jgi:murein L,D-transpeptidase YcbB/YkuD
VTLTWPLEQQGSTGEDVRAGQYLLTAQGHPTGVDGDYGPLTKAAVQAYQSSRGLSADGIVGPLTWPQLIIQVQQGSEGDAVSAVQSQIRSRGAGAGEIVIDGRFGSITNDAVRAFQMLLGLSVDGIVGPQTWNHLVNHYLAARDAQNAAKDVFSAWEAHNRDQAALNATPEAVSQIFARTFSPGDGWSFEGAEGGLGTIYSTWKRSNGHLLTIGVTNAVDGPYFAAHEVQFT